MSLTRPVMFFWPCVIMYASKRYAMTTSMLSFASVVPLVGASSMSASAWSSSLS